MFLKDISISGLPNSSYNVVRFNWQTHCIEDLYLRNLIPYKNDFIKKLNVILIGKDDQDRFSSTGLKLNVFQNMLSIGEVFLHFDFEIYEKTDEYNKKQMVLNKIQQGFEVFSKGTMADFSPFKKAYQKCMEAKLENELVLKENLLSKNKYSATVKLKVDLENLQTVAVIKNLMNGTQMEKIFFTEKPEALFSYYLGSIKWTENNVITLFDKTGQHKWTVAL